jgi:hypothetical protein
MARLQILELPEGADDSRPPFVLVVDETVPQRVIIGMDQGAGRDYWDEVAERIGARGVIVTPETVEIPANDVTLPDPRALVAEVFTEAQQLELVDRMDEITDALGLDRLRNWKAIVSAAMQIQIDGASGHRFGDQGPGDPLHCSKCGIERAEWLVRRDAPSCATVLLEKGLI